jgi:zinc finger SWIM domain-containing protein 3
VDENGKFVSLFWADATSRKNYNHFGDLVSFGATYSTNQYNMKFTHFIGINHHMQIVFFRAGFLLNEKIESYKWLLKTFLKAMGGKPQSLLQLMKMQACDLQLPLFSQIYFTGYACGI